MILMRACNTCMHNWKMVRLARELVMRSANGTFMATQKYVIHLHNQCSTFVFIYFILDFMHNMPRTLNELIFHCSTLYLVSMTYVANVLSTDYALD